MQWSLVISGWLAWTCDAMDFFTVSLAIPILSKPPPVGFGRDTATLVRLVITVTLYCCTDASLLRLMPSR